MDVSGIGPRGSNDEVEVDTGVDWTYTPFCSPSDGVQPNPIFPA